MLPAGACVHRGDPPDVEKKRPSDLGYLYGDRKKGIPGYVSVVGHVPTFVIRGFPKTPAEIWHSPDGRLIDVDCGAAFPDLGGRLGCLCLETGEEFYVSARGMA